MTARAAVASSGGRAAIAAEPAIRCPPDRFRITACPARAAVTAVGRTSPATSTRERQAGTCLRRAADATVSAITGAECRSAPAGGTTVGAVRSRGALRDRGTTLPASATVPTAAGDGTAKASCASEGNCTRCHHAATTATGTAASADRRTAVAAPPAVGVSTDGRCRATAAACPAEAAVGRSAASAVGCKSLSAVRLRCTANTPGTTGAAAERRATIATSARVRVVGGRRALGGRLAPHAASTAIGRSPLAASASVPAAAGEGIAIDRHRFATGATRATRTACGRAAIPTGTRVSRRADGRRPAAVATSASRITARRSTRTAATSVGKAGIRLRGSSIATSSATTRTERCSAGATIAALRRTVLGGRRIAATATGAARNATPAETTSATTGIAERGTGRSANAARTARA